jgi:hypothetical protein
MPISDKAVTKISVVLWIVQAALALLFLFAGGAKLTMPAEVLAEQAGMPAMFLQFIAVAEILGAIGLIVPGLVHIRPGLTPLAAAGLVVIMIGATATTLMSKNAAMAPMPAFVGVLAAFVAYGRWRIAPFRGSRKLHG